MRNMAFMVSLKESTFKEYYRIYQKFENFISDQIFDWNDPYILEYFASHLGCMNKAYLAQKIVPALRFFANLDGKELHVPNSFSKVNKGFTRIWELCDKIPLEREGVEANAIHDYIINHNSSQDPYTYALTCAILVVGFRLFARPGELCKLKWSSVIFKKDGNVQFDLSGHKTDPFFREFDIVVDANKNNPKVCPVTVLKKYMDMVSHFKEADSPLFSFENDRFLSSDQISTIVKTAMDEVDPLKKVSGHSMRIGATTEGVSKGVSMTDLMIGGRWKSLTSLMRYARSMGLVHKQFSSTLFSTTRD